ncbi:transporter substrate-binding domain-containing protein [Thalassotalea euphylliae]|uniref:transporter substrate-binding domain-containing protein n=1 Tax=Thalassotalea euphylliae TaxID=1655234 RepID=UPI002163E2F4|nr:transporter substrate-binding domain-containing protein [Thalassotalea euphylliae]
MSRGTALGERYQTLQSELSVLEVIAHQESFTMLNRKRADYILLTESAAQPYLAQAKNAQVKMSTKSLESYSIRMSFSRTSACADVFSTFNERLKKKIANGRVQELSDNYNAERLHQLRL